MSYVVIDFETYYDKDYSLRKMTPAEYVFDPRFEVIGCAVKEPGVPAFWREGQWLTDYLWGLKDKVVISHNALFDMFILVQHYGVVPRLMVDTMGMARSLVYAFTGKVSLDAVAHYLGLPAKGTVLKSVSGMKGWQIAAVGLWNEYVAYGCNDATLCEGIFLQLAKQFPKEEYGIMDAVLRCAVLPQFELDMNLLAEYRVEIAQAKDQLLQRCGLVDRTDLMSNEKFAGALQNLGVEPPRKVSPITGKETWAFAKSDPGMIDLSEHWNPAVQALIAARVGHKSTIEETRAERLHNIGLLMFGRIPIPLRYSGAHTHRLSGDWKLNPQNWSKYSPRADGTKETGKLRRAHKAPQGKTVVKCDASQIEARIVAWLAGQTDLVEAFRKGEDIYSDFAQNNIYHYPVNKTTVDERFVGKQCILGLGFQSGAEKFRNNLAAKSFEVLGRQIVLELPEATRIVHAYRSRYSCIPEAWNKLRDHIPELAAHDSKIDFGPVRFGLKEITLPNGHRLFYHDLHFNPAGKDGKGQWEFKYGSKIKHLFGGKLYENIVQSLARICTMSVVPRMAKHYPHVQLAHQVHDDLVYLVPDELVGEFRQALREEMSTPPAWAPDLPLDAEDAAGPNYGDAKP